MKKDEYGATTFSNLGSGGSLGSLTIKQLSNVKPNEPLSVSAWQAPAPSPCRRSRT